MTGNEKCRQKKDDEYRFAGLLIGSKDHWALKWTRQSLFVTSRVGLRGEEEDEDDDDEEDEDEEKEDEEP